MFLGEDIRVAAATSSNCNTLVPSGRDHTPMCMHKEEEQGKQTTYSSAWTGLPDSGGWHRVE